MIQGRMLRGRIMIDNEADASTLRNKGSVGINVGQKLSLDLMTSLDLVIRKKMEVARGKKRLSEEQLRRLLTADESKIATAYHYLKFKGLRPEIKKKKLYLFRGRVTVFHDSESINFTKLGKSQNYIAIVDSDGNCLVYSARRLPIRGWKLAVGNAGRNHELSETLNGSGMRMESGLKFGSEFRVYEAGSSHAKYLMTIGDSCLARDLVGRVRIAQSVRKTYVQAILDRERNSFNYLEFRWIRK